MKYLQPLEVLWATLTTLSSQNRTKLFCYGNDVPKNRIILFCYGNDIPKTKHFCSVSGIHSQNRIFVLFLGTHSHDRTFLFYFGNHSHNRTKLFCFWESILKNRTKLFCFWENFPKTEHFGALGRNFKYFVIL